MNEFDQLITTFIAGVGGAVLNIAMAFSKRFNAWLDKYTPAQKYYITMFITGVVGALIAFGVSCSGILRLIGCDTNAAPNLALSAFAACGGNQSVYNGIKAFKKTSQQNEAQEVAGVQLVNPDAPSGGGGYG